MKTLLRKYKEKKPYIKQRLREFKRIGKNTDEDIFSELCFCILTPQSRAIACDAAIKELIKSGLLFRGAKRAVRAKLKGVRFPNNKAAFLIKARETLRKGSCIKIKNRLNGNIQKTRDWLVKNIKGIGYKEASHFLRNIGLGSDIAILDVHILRNLKRYGVINEIPPSLTRKTYLATEEKMKKFSRKSGIPLPELDLLFWSNQTGFIFK